MDEQRHINLLEAYIDSRLTADERRELEGLLVQNAAVRKLFWETMQQHAFTQELLGEAQGRSIALTESRAATLESLQKEAARMGGNSGAAALSASASASAAASASAGPAASARVKTGRQAGASAVGGAAGLRRSPRPAAASSRMFWMTVAAGLLLVGGVGGWLYLHEPARTPAVARVQPIATLQTAGSAGGFVVRGTSSMPLAAPLELYSGDLVKTNPGAKDATATTVNYPDGTRLQLAAGVSVTLLDCSPATLVLPNGPGASAAPSGGPVAATAQGGKRLELDDGTLTAAVTPQPAGKPLTIATPHAELLVVGTQFNLAVTGAKTRLTVQEGHVQFTSSRDSHAVQVLAKQYAEAGDGIELAVKAVEEPKPPVVATEPRHEPEHPAPVTHSEDFATDELQGRVTEMGEKTASFTVVVTRAGNKELVGRSLPIFPGWNADRKQPKELDLKQVHELRVGDVVRMRVYFEEHYRFRTMAVVEHAKREEPKPRTELPPAPAVENRDGAETKPLHMDGDGKHAPDGH